MVQQVNININQLKFDPENPRLPKGRIDTTNEFEVIDYMVRYGNIVELMQSIGQTGYSIAEPLLVVPDSSNEGYYFVVEGNRRLSALKLLVDPSLARVRSNNIKQTVEEAVHVPTEVPVIVYPEREKVLDYLGYRHITGVKDWGALEKARYLDQLYNSHIDTVSEGKIYSVLAKMIGSRTDYVAKLHTALKLYELANDRAYFGSNIDEQDIDFSWITTALSYRSTISYMGLESTKDPSLSGLDENKYSQLFSWLFDPKKKKVEESRDIEKLNKILESPIAVEKLSQGSAISEAVLFTSQPKETFKDLILRSKTSLQSAKGMIEQLNDYPEDIVVLLDEVEKISKSIKGALTENFRSQESSLDSMSADQMKQMLLALIQKEKQGE